MMEKMTTDFACDCFANGIDCSQVVFGYAAEKLGFDADTARKIAAAFGGGMWHGETCGCVVGALMAIGLKYGPCEKGDAETKQNMLAKKQEFEEKFAAKSGGLICKKMLGYDLSVPEEMAKIMEENLLMTKCPQFACNACDILDKILD